MAGNYTIPVDVELRTKQQNVKNLRSSIENEFRDIDFNSSIGKQLNKLFNQFDAKISDMDSILGKGILDMGDLNKLNSIFNRMNLIVGQMRSSAHKAPLVDLGIDAQSIPELVEARNLVKQITSEMAKQKAVSTKDRLKETGQQDLLDDLNKIQKTRAHENKPLGVNAKIIQDELAEAEHLIKQHYEKRDQLDKQFQEKSAKAKQSQKILDDAEADYVKNAQKASLKQIMALETAAGKKGKKSTLESQFGGGNKLSQKSAQKFLDEFMVEAGMAFEGTQISGTLTKKLWDGMFTENEIAQMQQAGGDMGEALYAGLEQKLLDPTSRERFRQIVHDFSKNTTGSAEGYANTADNIKNNLPNLMNQAKADAVEVQAIEQSQIDNANAIATLEPQIASFKAVVDRLATAASTLEAVVQNKYQKELNEANRAAEHAKTNVVDQKFPTTANAQVGNQPVPQYQNEIESLKGADQFKNELKQSISQWMGVREVIGYIKQGIHQAWADIQGLDKAMTNIAVVTDFSVSDLWGKVNEYMSVAQQYGVTTQGVYEVSQLYFQQGLGEADTMAATTETLKMARIAGMDYAEAADGMTVAIRGFNMEMSEASRVTDVYSKVAAITASDTQELVTAMSKTASSAAAVGSSFENTTAMLAVMIEATRESPQNLGSALKSIISRYGEMTKGLSEDSEGEEIDYNRVDAALKTVGISIKDAQGQFRDFDTVIEELSAKWDTLDSVTQRYIATIFAGNRQQSRFLALVSNYDRYMEVSQAAANSEDAGLLQYSKTLDSLETKLNNMKTGFQQFYMGIFNGPVAGGFLDFINNAIKGLNKLSKFTAILNIGSIIGGIKSLANLLLMPFSQLGHTIADGVRQGFAQAISETPGMVQQLGDTANNAAQQQQSIATKKKFNWGAAAQIVGGGLSFAGTRVAKENQTAGAVLSGVGNTLSYAAMGAQIGGIYGAIIGALLGIVSAIASWPSKLEKAQQELEKAEEKAQEAQVRRAEAKERSTGLEETIEKLKELKEHQYDSAEAQEEFIKANNEAYEKFPELTASFDEFGNAVINIQSAEEALTLARESTAAATLDAARAEMEKIQAQRETNRLSQEEHLDNARDLYSLSNGTSESALFYDSIHGLSNIERSDQYEDAAETIREQEIARREDLAELSGDRLNNRQRREIGDQAEADNQEQIIAMARDAIIADSIQTALGEDAEQFTVDFVRERIEARLVTEEEFQEQSTSGNMQVTRDMVSTIGEDGSKTFQEVSQSALDFLYRNADFLNLHDEATVAFVDQLLNTADDLSVIDSILSNYTTLSWKPGVDSTKLIASQFGYDYSNWEDARAFDEVVAKNNTFNRNEAGYDHALDSNENLLISTNVNSLLNKDSRLKDSISGITGLQTFLRETAINKTSELGANALLTETETYGLIQEEMEALRAFSEQAKERGYADEVSQLVEAGQSGAISRDNFLAQMHGLGFDVEGNEILSSFTDYIFESAENIKENAVKSLKNSQVRWTSDITGADINGELFPDNILNGIAENYVSSITDFNNYLENSINEGNLSKERANHMAMEYARVWEATTSLPAEQIAQAQKLLSEADLTTTLGKEDLLSQLQEANIDDSNLTNWINNFSPYAENLITQYGILQDKLISGLSSVTEAIKQASEGASLEEATKMAKKVGKDVLELFNFQDGQYFAKDTNSLKQIYDTYSQSSIDSLNQTLSSQLELLSESAIPVGTETEYIVSHGGQGNRPEIIEQQRTIWGHSEEYNALYEQYRQTALEWFSGLDEAQKEAEGLSDASTNVDIIKAYLVDYSEDVARAIEEEADWQFKQAEKALLINNRTHQLESAGVGKDLREAYSLLSSKGLSGYSANEIAQLETYLGVGAGRLGAVETGVGTGEYKIDNSALQNLPIWVQNAIKSIIDGSVQSAKDGLEALAESVASQEQLTSTQKREILGDEFSDWSDSAIEGIWSEYQNAMISGNFDRLQNVLYQHFNAEDNVDDAQAERMTKESIARFKDNISEDANKLIELQLSALEGNISAEDAYTLSNRDIDVTNLIRGAREEIANLVQSIVDNTDFSFEDKVSNLQKVYDVGLEKLLGHETSIADTLTSREGFSRSNAASMMAELTALGIQTEGIFEESADGTKFYLNNLLSIISDIETSMSNMDQSSKEYATAKNLLQQINYIREWQPYELADSLGSTIEEMANATEVSTIEMRDFYKELTGRDISVNDAQRLARELNELDPVARIERLVAIARQSGIEVEGMEERLSEVAANILDTIIEAISSGMSAIGEGLAGSLSFSSLNELMQKYNLQVQDSFGTASGATLGEQDRRSLIGAMYKEAKASGLQVDFGDQLWETFRDSDNNPFVGYNAIEEGIANARQQAEQLRREAQQQQQEISSNEDLIAQLSSPILTEREAAREAVAAAEALVEETQQAAENAEQYAQALEQARAAAMFDENAYEFSFMERDATSGLTKTADNFINQIDKVKGALNSFKNDEAISYQDFYNMMDFMKNTGQWEEFSENISEAGIEYEDFVNKVVANTDEWGKVDIGGVAAQMGISVDAAMTAMADSMKSGLMEVARQQVDYLTGLEKMLLAMAALEQIGEIKLGFDVTLGGETKTAEEWINKWEQLGDDERKDLIIALKTEESGMFDENGMLKQDLASAMDGIFGEGFSARAFQQDAEGYYSAITGYFLQATVALNKAIQDGSGETAQGVALAMMNARDKYLAEVGLQLEQLDESQQAELYKLMANAAKNAKPLNLADFSEMYQRALLAGDTEATVDVSGATRIKLKYDGTVELVDAEGNPVAQDQLDTEALARLEEQLNANRSDTSQYYEVVRDIQGNVVYNIVPTQVHTFLAQENLPQTLTVTPPNGGPEVQVQVTYDPSNATVTFTGPNGEQITDQALLNTIQQQFATQNNLADQGILLNQTGEGNGQFRLGVAITSELSETTILTEIASSIADIKESLNDGLDLNINSEGAIDQLNAIQQAFETLRSTLQTPINLQINSSGIGGGQGDGSGGEQQNPVANGDTSEVSVQYNTEIDGETPPLDDATPQIDYETEINGEVPPIGNGEYTITYTTVVNGETPPQSYTGTMNAITGPAYADGSIGRIYSGAQLANKTLVGELGPELAVYNGQYHLLGQTGAEFVKLPKSAIVFNHLQTRGILNGQMKTARGTPLEPNSAMVTGNVSGPALAGGGGIGAALAAVRRAKSVWEGLLSSLTASDLLDNGGGGGGGGGGDESLKAHIADLQEWYNLSRQIADIEGQINILLAKRKSLTDGHEYLKNLRATQKLLEDQVNTQEDLLRFQELQLQRQAEHINTHDIWSQFLEVNENGLLQYIEGNETNGGKGALEVLQKMNEMTGAEQVAYVKSLGYTYEPPQEEGEEVDEEEREKEIVAKFYEELQKQIDDYDALRDTVVEAEEAMANLEEEIRAIDQEIRENEIDLSQEIYDIIVKAWEENIANLKEQNDLIKEANEAYANGIQKAIDAERQMYEQNTAISDREQLQRQLALMRRSGGSASEIADLEQQLDDMLKEEYFSNQEKQLETIQKANERQVELMDQQVKLQEEALEYEKENGVIWTKVYEVMQGTDAEILDFMQGNSTDFFEQSALQQEDMLTEWAKKIGIYTEERQRQNYAADAAKTFSSAWETEQGKDLKAGFDKADAEQQEKWKREYNDTYASKRLEGKTHEEALALAQKELYEHIQNWLKAEEDKKKQNSSSNNSSSNNSSNNSSSNSGGRYVTVTYYQATGRVGGSQGEKTVSGPRNTNSAQDARNGLKSRYPSAFGISVRSWTAQEWREYATGGIIDYTGPAWVDGSKSKPERILSAEQNRILEEGLAMNAGRSDRLREMFSNFAENLGASVRASISNITNRTSDSAITIQPGAVQLNIEQLNDKYDVDELFNDVADRLYSIASKASGRGVSRR